MRLSLVAALLVLGACSRTTEGPTPKVVGTVNPRQINLAPARVCNAQGEERGWRVDLLGERFTPVPQDTLTDTPKVGLPEVTLKGPATLTLGREHVFYEDDTRLRLYIPTRDSTPAEELPLGSYAVEVKNAGGGTGELADLLIVVPPPTVASVTAPQGFSFGAPSPLVVEGTGFRAEAFPRILLVREGVQVELFVTTVESPTRIATEIPSGTPEGTYDFVLTNAEGCSVMLQDALHITYARLGLLTLEPRFGWQRRNQPITLYNAPTGDERAFSRGSAEVFLVAPLKSAPTEPVDIPLHRVAFVSPTLLTAVVPTCSGSEALPLSDTDCPNGIVPGGPYALKVVDTGGAVGEVPAAQGFTVLENEPPVIDAISPSAIDTRGLGESNPLVVTGRSFGAGARVQLLQQVGTGNIRACDLPATGTASATRLSAQVPATSLPPAQCVEYTPTGTQVAATEGLQLAAGLYVVRVQNTADPAYANYSGLVVTNPAANPERGPALASRLTTARADFPLVTATDDLGQPFLYALGGTDGTTPLASVEVAPVTLFGDVGGACDGTTCTFHTLERTPLGVGTAGDTPEPRRGLMAVVRTVPEDTSYLFVLGGVRGSDGKAVSTVERAQVLKVADAPVLLPPERLTQEGATLPPGTFYYRVSAVLDASDAENPNGETLSSDEYPVKATEAFNAARLTWRCVPGAAKYRVYRTATPNEPSGAERLLEELAAPGVCTGSPLPQVSYEDTGAKTPAADGPQPLPPGALGRWVRVNVPQLSVERGNAAARLVGDTVYVSGGFCSMPGPGCAAANDILDSVERATFTANRLELSAFTAAGTHSRKRQRHSLAVANATTAPASFTSTNPDIRQDVWLLAVGGDQGGAPLEGTGIIEVAQVRTLSGEVPAPTFSAAAYNTAGTHGGWTEVIANSLYQAGTTSGAGFKFDSARVCRGTGNDPGQCTASSQFSGALNSTAESYQQGGPRYLAGTTRFRAYLYIAGGLPHDTGGTPTSSLERFFF